ncbi:MAG: Mur ligase family protein [Bacteroidota bacterium]|nr:Mur ligase family protein [Bacteroidota bacterium]
MNYHFISIGGAVMHNMALALHQLGHTITGSDDEIFEPAKSRLANAGLLPNEIGWFPEKVDANLNGVILGMHAKANNPELLKAKELNIPIYSFPQFIYEHAKDKTRVVIGGSHGKTTSTAMLMHVLRETKRDFDYMVGSQLAGFDTMVKLSNAPLTILEGDEYLTSPLDLRPKFHLYFPQIAMLTGIAWDHINVFPTFENYIEQFEIFINQLPDGAPLAYYEGDEHLQALAAKHRGRLRLMPYRELENRPTNIDGYKTIIQTAIGPVGLKIFGQHNLQNLAGVYLLSKELGIGDLEFYQAISTFDGTAKRLELLYDKENTTVYRDFAHSPSKLKATVNAVREQYINRKLTACFELHTYSSLNKDFLKEYQNSMDVADDLIIYYNAHSFEIKKMEPLQKAEVQNAFGTKAIIFDQTADLQNFLQQLDYENRVLLLMSSGSFDGIALNFWEK